MTLDVTVINQYYPPDASATAATFQDLAEELVQAGHRVTVICGRPSYNPSERQSWRLLSREQSGGLSIVRVGATSMDRKRMWGRALNYLTFTPGAAAFGLFRRRCDVVVVGSDPPLAVWAGLIGARGRPVVYSLQDLHPEFAIVSKMINPGLITWFWRALHDAALKRCRLVVCLGEGVRQRLLRKGVNRGRVVVVPTGAATAAGAPDAQLVAEIRGGAPFVVMHAGNLGGAGAWETLSKASRMIDDVQMVFVGDGFNAQSISREGLRVIPFQPIEKLSSVMAAGDLQVVTLNSGMEGLLVPSKIYTALAHGRPVLAVAPEQSEISQIVRRFDCGMVADPSDPDDVVEKITWARDHLSALNGMAKRSLIASAEFRREEQLQRLVELIEHAAQKVAKHK